MVMCSKAKAQSRAMMLCKGKVMSSKVQLRCSGVTYSVVGLSKGRVMSSNVEQRQGFAQPRPVEQRHSHVECSRVMPGKV